MKTIKKKTKKKKTKKKKTGKYIWTYKDGQRCYWRFEVEKADDGYFDEEYEHQKWEYSVFRDEDCVHEGIFVGQYDKIPSLFDVLMQYHSYIGALVAGAAKYGCCEVK